MTLRLATLAQDDMNLYKLITREAGRLANAHTLTGCAEPAPDFSTGMDSRLRGNESEGL